MEKKGVFQERVQEKGDVEVSADRRNEPTISYEQLLKELKKDGKI